MFSLNKTHKTIGTLVPLSALSSTKVERSDNGTFAVGLPFLKWLKKTHQSAWQLLPLHQTQLESGSTTKHVPSPYKSYGIGLDPKYLPEDFIGIYPSQSEKNNFMQIHKDWLPDYALFCALTEHFQTDNWITWDEGLKNRDQATIDRWHNQLAKEIDNHIILQWQLHQGYTLIRKKAKELGIVLIGDLPFYPSLQSPLVWAYQDAFQIEKNGTMQYVSGIPHVQGSHFGRQVWGHPLYNWSQKEKVMKLWQIRLNYQTTLFNQIRFDHAKGIFEYGAIDRANEQNDHLVDGPGAEVLKKLISFSRQHDLSIFVEDNNDTKHMLRSTLKELNVPGIKIFRFALKKDGNSINNHYAKMSDYPTNYIAYTTTHDTETLVDFLHTLTPEQKQKLAEASQILYNPDDFAFAKLIRDGVLASPAQTVIIPIQDWLLTTDRINTPGTELPVNDPNWHFQLKIPIEHLPSH